MPCSILVEAFRGDARLLYHSEEEPLFVHGELKVVDVAPRSKGGLKVAVVDVAPQAVSGGLVVMLGWKTLLEPTLRGRGGN